MDRWGREVTSSDGKNLARVVFTKIMLCKPESSKRVEERKGLIGVFFFSLKLLNQNHVPPLWINSSALQGPSGWHIKTKLEVKKGEKEFYILSRMGRNRKTFSFSPPVQTGESYRTDWPPWKFQLKANSVLRC